MNFLELLEEASKQDNVNEIMNSWADIIDNYICETKEENKNVYDELINDLYITIYGEHLNEEMAKKWVENMKPVGEHWTIDETKKALPSLQEAEGYAIANLIYNDYYDVIKSNDTLVMKMALDWVNDEDAESNKVYRYWKYITKN